MGSTSAPKENQGQNSALLLDRGVQVRPQEVKIRSGAPS